jgi:stage V sporulation protein AA
VIFVVTTIYIRLHHRVQVKRYKPILLKDIAIISAPEKHKKILEPIEIHKVSKKDQNIVVLDGIKIIQRITENIGNCDIQLVGPQQTIIEIVTQKVKMSKPLFLLAWLLLFIGSAFTIMNFHEDTSMQAVHQKLFYLMTGIKDSKPLSIQIPYSIGLGLGMILFFNHVFKKRINEEPSPLEVEMFNYQQNIDHYMIINESEESVKRIDES